MNNKKLLVFMFLFVLSIFMISAKTFNLDIKKAIDIAMKNNPEILQEIKKYDQAKEKLYLSYSHFLPSVDLNGYKVLKEKVMTIEMPPFYPGQPTQKIQMDFTKNYQLTFQFVQPLFTGGKLLFGTKIADSLKKAQYSLIKAKKDEIKAKTKSMFFSILLLEKSKEIVLNGKKLAEDTYNKIKVMFEQGLVKKLDLLRAENKVIDMDAKLKEIEAKIFEAENNLKIVLGISLDDKILVKGIIDENIISLNADKMIQEMMENNPIIKSLEEQKRVSKNNLKMAYSDFFPTIAINGQYNLRGDKISEISEWEDYYSVNLSITYSLFKGFSKKFNLKIAKAQKQESDIRIMAYRRNLYSNLMNLVKKNNYFIEKIISSKLSFKNTKEELEIAKTSYEEGLISYTDLELIENQNLSAELNYYQSIFEYYTNIFTIETFVSQNILKF